MSKYPKYIMDCLRQRRELNIDDKSEDDIINNYTSSKAFEEVLAWKGLSGWETLIKEVIKDIYGIDLNSH